MFALELIKRMNSCIINIINNDVFITFLQIVKKGSVKFWSMGTNDNYKLTGNRSIANTNFESFSLGDFSGKVKIEIIMDGQQIIKNFTIQ